MLLLSLITLFAGPLLFQWLSAAHPLAKTVERFVVAALIGLLLLLMIPEILDPLGLAAPALVRSRIEEQIRVRQNIRKLFNTSQ